MGARQLQKTKLRRVKESKNHLRLLPEIPKETKKTFIHEINKSINILKAYKRDVFLSEMKSQDQKALKNFLKKYILQQNLKPYSDDFEDIKLHPVTLGAIEAGLGYGLVSFLQDALKFNIKDLENFAEDTKDVYVQNYQMLDMLTTFKKIYKKIL